MTVRWFRREPSGRHALGAAVTAIPTGPPTAPVVLPVPTGAEPMVPVQVVEDAVAPARVQAAPVVADAAPPAAPAEPVDIDVPAAPTTAVLPVSAAADLPVMPVLHVPSQPLAAPPAQAFVPAQAGSSEPFPVEHLHALAPLGLPPVPAEPAAAQPFPAVPPAASADDVAPTVELAEVVQPVQPPRNGPRVELGFADGTYRMLDPESETARVLADLVGELTSAPPREAPADNPGPGHSGPS